jgi:hypothetical protein
MHILPLLLFTATVVPFGAISWQVSKRRKDEQSRFAKLQAILYSYALRDAEGRRRLPDGAFKVAPAQTFRICMQVLITVAVFAGTVYVAVSHRYGCVDKDWAYGSAGALLGFWIRA